MTTYVVMFADKHPSEMYTGKDSTIVLNPQQSPSRHLPHPSSGIMRINNMGVIYFTTITQAIYPYRILRDNIVAISYIFWV